MAVRSNAMRASGNPIRPRRVRYCGSSFIRFLQKSISAIELAEHILSLVARGERNMSRLKVSAFKRLGFEARKPLHR